MSHLCLLRTMGTSLRLGDGFTMAFDYWLTPALYVDNIG